MIIKKVKNLKLYKSPFVSTNDPYGHYTGVNINKNDKPEQDVDDL